MSADDVVVPRVVPSRGAPCGIRFDGRLRWHWWGSEDDGGDLVASRGARVLAWESEQDWLARRSAWLDVGAGLGLWNWAVDVSRSTGGSWDPRGRTVDVCYRKLFAANVPYSSDLESYRPQWASHQLTALRRVLGEAVHVVRAGCGDLPGRAGRRQKNSSSRR